MESSIKNTHTDVRMYRINPFLAFDDNSVLTYIQVTDVAPTST